jgi:hypothetical protein
MTKLTAETITIRQIRDLRAEAEEYSDYHQVDWCDLALAAHETSDADGHHLQSPDGDRAVTRTEARQICADAINAARAQADQ